MIRVFDNLYTVLENSVIIIAAIVAWLCYKKYKHSKMRFFIYFLIYIAFFQCLAHYTYSVRYDGVLSFLDTTIFRHNYWLITLYWTIGAILFYSWFFSKFIITKFYMKLIRRLSLIYLCYSIIKIFMNINDFFSSDFTSLVIFGNSLLIVSISLYFIEILKLNKILNFHKTNIFYIASIVLIWLLITIPLEFYDQYYNIKDPAFVKLRRVIYFYVNFFMYIGFALVLIFGKPEKSINEKYN